MLTYAFFGSGWKDFSHEKKTNAIEGNCVDVVVSWELSAHTYYIQHTPKQMLSYSLTLKTEMRTGDTWETSTRSICWWCCCCCCCMVVLCKVERKYVEQSESEPCVLKQFITIPRTLTTYILMENKCSTFMILLEVFFFTFIGGSWHLTWYFNLEATT